MVDLPSLHLVDYYRRHLGFLDDRDFSYEESMNVIVTRDVLEDQWDELTSEERALVESLDNILASKHKIVSEVLPTMDKHERHRWWWHLHEGPQVKSEAERLAAASRA
jgi:DNA replication initiation complex subunit (GINS family)